MVQARALFLVLASLGGAAVATEATLELAATSLTDALHVSDECGDGIEGQCALNAAQLRVRKVSQHRVEESSAQEEASAGKAADRYAQAWDLTSGGWPWSQWSDASETIEAAVGKEKWDELKGEFKKSDMAKGVSCIRLTKGTCFMSACSYSRGLTECSKGMCWCQEGYCATRGKCLKDQKLPCEQLAEGAVLRESAWRDLEDKCKCPKGKTVQGAAEECKPYLNERYFPLTLKAGACHCQ
jgi:hypothetical protein